MLFTEFNLEDAVAVRYEDGLADGRAEGLAEGKLQITRNALAENLPFDVIQKITGLDLEVIKELQS